MLLLEDIAQLVAHDFGTTNLSVYVRVSGQHEHLARNGKPAVLDVPAVLCKLHVQVAHVLYSHCRNCKKYLYQQIR